MSDEQFHEFHLDGKQMVFLFMASTVVAVVIFLCGVMVGRGVRANRVEPQVVDLPLQQELSPSPDDAEPLTGVDPGLSSLDIPDDFRYSRVLQDPTSPPPDPIRRTPSEPERRAAAPVSAEAPPSFEQEPDQPGKVDNPSKPKPDVKATLEGVEAPAGPGYVVQVASLKKLSDAQAIRKDLIGKGYQTFISETETKPKLYRVRVGTYPTLSKARAVEQQLEKVHKFRNAWTVPL